MQTCKQMQTCKHCAADLGYQRNDLCDACYVRSIEFKVCDDHSAPVGPGFSTEPDHPQITPDQPKPDRGSYAYDPTTGQWAMTLHGQLFGWAQSAADARAILDHATRVEVCTACLRREATIIESSSGQPVCNRCWGVGVAVTPPAHGMSILVGGKLVTGAIAADMLAQRERHIELVEMLAQMTSEEILHLIILIILHQRSRLMQAVAQ